jgi:hypothetical protein
MSYDLYLFPRRAGLDDQELIDAWEQEVEEREELNPGALDAVLEERKAALAARLQEALPAFRRQVADYDEVARVLGVSVREARRQYRHIDLEDDLGVSVALYDTEVAINIPFAPGDDTSAPEMPQRARHEALRRALAAGGLLQGATGWVVYDPQLERLVDPKVDAREIGTVYHEAASKLPDLLTVPPEPGSLAGGGEAAVPEGAPREPWWRRWFPRE